MKISTVALFAALTLALFVFAQRRTPAPRPLQFSGIIDLTHTLSEKSPNWEGTAKSPFEAKPHASLDKDGYFTRDICLPEHFSTHVDAPAHFAAGRWTVDQIPPERLLAPLVVIDVAGKAVSNPDYEVSMSDIVDWEQTNGHIPPGAMVAARTGWSQRWNSMKDYRNADAKGVMHFPGFSLDAVKFLVEGRNLYGLGIDTLSVDPGDSSTYPVHKYDAARSVYHVENLSDLSKVPVAGALVMVAPAKLEGGSGGPVRVFVLMKMPEGQ